MPSGKVNNEPLVRLREGVEPDDECVGTLPDCALECRGQSLGLSHVEKLRLEAEGSRCRLDLFPRRGKRGVREAEVAARSLKMRLQIVEARAPSEFAGAFSAAAKGQSGALVVLGGPMHFVHRARLVEMATQSRLAAVYGAAEFARVGGLMSYGINLRDMFRRAAGYVDRILKGAKPRDLPVEQPTKFELVINLKTAKALGLTIPPSLLQRADQVIE